MSSGSLDAQPADRGAAALRAELALRASFLIALCGALGSLFASEVLGYPPCSLCWYQRIALYPLVVVFGVALWSGDRGHGRYSAPLCGAGLLLAAYHNLLYYGVIPERLAPCRQGVSCTDEQLLLAGFVTIPLLSLLAFAALCALQLVARAGVREPMARPAASAAGTSGGRSDGAGQGTRAG